MANFLTAYNATMNNEGGYRNVSYDKGGETYKGIARNYHPDWPGWSIVDSYKQTHTLKTGAIINDTRLDGLVMSFYQDSFWTPANLANVNNQSLANLCFDIVVQHGRGPTVINKGLVLLETIPVINKVTADSVRVMNKYPQNAYNNIVQQRIDYINSLSLGPDQAGVLARAKSFLNKYVAVAATGAGIIAGFFFSFY